MPADVVRRWRAAEATARGALAGAVRRRTVLSAAIAILQHGSTGRVSVVGCRQRRMRGGHARAPLRIPAAAQTEMLTQGNKNKILVPSIIHAFRHSRTRYSCALAPCAEITAPAHLQ
eukprot:6195180-Pleurochrysis_carterae.AAC.2